jgi:hypothetical protein
MAALLSASVAYALALIHHRLCVSALIRAALQSLSSVVSDTPTRYMYIYIVYTCIHSVDTYLYIYML